MLALTALLTLASRVVAQCLLGLHSAHGSYAHCPLRHAICCLPLPSFRKSFGEDSHGAINERALACMIALIYVFFRLGGGGAVTGSAPLLATAFYVSLVWGDVNPWHQAHQ